jgi:hypothetical protein
MYRFKTAVLWLTFSIALAFLQPIVAEASEPSITVTFDRYHTFAEIEQIFEEFESLYPDLASLHVIGQSFLGRNLLALEITNKETGSPETKPGTLFVSTHHGNEIIGTEIALYYAWYLLTNYPDDPQVRKIVDEKTVYIIPVLNPDGHNITLSTNVYQRWNARPFDDDGDGLNDEDPPEDINGDGKITDMRMWDESRHRWIHFYWEGIDNDGDGLINEDWIGGIDLNRNYDYAWIPIPWHGEYPFSEPETAAIRDFVLSHPNIATALDTHSGTRLVLFPWGYTRRPSPDYTTFKRLGIEYGKMTGYKDEQSALLYPAFGLAEDWMYGKRGIIYFTNEVFGPAPWNPGGWKIFTKDYPDAEQPWQDFVHPQLGPVQIGGFWHFRYFNPPEEEIEVWALKNVPMLLNLAEITPKLEITSISINPIEQNGEFTTYSIDATIYNSGFLATSTKQSIITGAADSVIVEFETGPEAELIAGEEETNLGVLQGYESVTLNWNLKAYGTTWIRISASSEKGGLDTISLEIGE